MDLPIGLVFEIMLFRSSFYRKTLDSVFKTAIFASRYPASLIFAYGLQFPQGVYPCLIASARLANTMRFLASIS